MKALDVKKQVENFQKKPHEEKLRIVKSILNILWDDAWDEIKGLKDTINNFWENTTDEDLMWIFESIMTLVENFREYENLNK